MPDSNGNHPVSFLKSWGPFLAWTIAAGAMYGTMKEQILRLSQEISVHDARINLAESQRSDMRVSVERLSTLLEGSIRRSDDTSRQIESINEYIGRRRSIREQQ